MKTALIVLLFAVTSAHSADDVFKARSEAVTPLIEKQTESDHCRRYMEDYREKLKDLDRKLKQAKIAKSQYRLNVLSRKYKQLQQGARVRSCTQRSR